MMIARQGAAEYNATMIKSESQQDGNPEIPWVEQPHVADLLRALRQMGNRDAPEIVSLPGGRTRTVNDVIREIEQGTPEGRRYVELDREAQARLAGMEQEKKAETGIIRRTLQQLGRLFGRIS